MESHNSKISDNQEKLRILNDLLMDKLDDLISVLGVKLRKVGKLYVGTCQIHGGDNKGAFNLYPDGHSLRGYWKCRTHNCEKTFFGNIIGFTRGILSHADGWRHNGDRIYDFRKTLNFLCEFLEIDYQDIKANNLDIDKRCFISKVLTFKERTEKDGISREIVKGRLLIPADYYLNRGYSREILTKYDVGTCITERKELYGRVVVPIYDDTGKLCVGCMGRSIFPKCTKCGLFHLQYERCPTQDMEMYNKWRASKGTNLNSYLYNYWESAKFIEKEKRLILVEGPPDVWRLESADIHNSLAIFGTSLSEEQQIIIEQTSALKLVVILDADRAGQNGAQEIYNMMKRSYNVDIRIPNKKDVGEMQEKEIRHLIL